MNRSWGEQILGCAQFAQIQLSCLAEARHDIAACRAIQSEFSNQLGFHFSLYGVSDQTAYDWQELSNTCQTQEDGKAMQYHRTLNA